MSERPVESSPEVRLRPAAAADVDFLLALAGHDEVEPYLAPYRATDREGLLERVERAAAVPHEHGQYVIEVTTDGRDTAAGAVAFDLTLRLSRIAQISAVMLHPDHRGRGVAEAGVRLLAQRLLGELGYHRLQLESYAFNAAGARLFERAGFVREGVRRRAYWRHERWNDGVLFGLTAEDLR